jgi:hypothetical protein
MATGDSTDMLDRVKRLIPRRWFSYAAPYRDALLGGLADSSAFIYQLISYARSQTRLATASGIFLDLLAFDFLGRFIARRTLGDDDFRAKIRATILQERVTRAGMINALTMLTGNTPWIFEPWNTGDTGAYSGAGQKYGSMGYGVGQGGWGSMSLPNQFFIKPKRGAGSGVPNVDGWGGYQGGYGTGSIEFVNQVATFQTGVTNADINAMITYTKPTGVTAWTNIG